MVIWAILAFFARGDDDKRYTALTDRMDEQYTALNTKLDGMWAVIGGIQQDTKNILGLSPFDVKPPVPNTSTPAITPIHYWATLKICSYDNKDYKMNVDFYGLNPRVEAGMLLTGIRNSMDELYLPIEYKNYEDEVCGMYITKSE